MSATDTQETAVSAAFSAQSPAFDRITTSNPMEVFYRDVVHSHVLQYARPGQAMLELNCGTGIDAFFFAGKGLTVHATDNSEGMLQQLEQKMRTVNPPPPVSFQKCSYNDLSALRLPKKPDHVFSNFGGLNCTADLHGVIRQVDERLEKEGMVHFVMIAPVCLWEWMTIFKGKTKFAFRRLAKKGVKSHLEGHYFMTYYYSASYISNSFGKDYELAQLRSMGCFLPPTFNDYFPSKYPRLFRFLQKMESALNTSWPFNRIGDLYIISLRKK